MKRFLFLSLIPFLIASCGGDFITPDGIVISEEYEVSDFHSVNISIPAEVKFVQSNDRLVRIEANENLFSVFNVSVQNGVLTIESDENIRNPKIINVFLQQADLDLMIIRGSGTIDFPSCIDTNELKLETSGSGNISVCGLINHLDLEIQGSGNITAQDVTAQSITTLTRGSGDVSLSGSGTKGTYAISGSGRISAYQMVLNEIEASISGSGNINTTVKENLNVSISGSGDLNYKGNPTISSTVSGSGRVRNAN